METPNQQQYTDNVQANPSNPAQPLSSASPNPPKRSGMAVASLVLGIVAIVLSWMPIINNFAFILAVPGIVFAIIGLVGAMKGRVAGKGMAIAGLVLGVVTVVVVLASQAMYSAAIDEAVANLNAPSSSSASSTEETTDDGSTSASAGSVSNATGETGSAQAAPKYAVSIDGCEQITDYQGKPAIMVTFTWTNNSDETRSFLTAISDKAFQNGVQLETAIVTDGNDSAGASMNDVKPGATTTVTQCFLLADSSPVTVECTEWASWNDEILAEREFTLN